MIQPVASQQAPLKSKAQQRRSGTTEPTRGVRTRCVQVLPGRPGNNPKPGMSNPSRRRLRLVGGGGDPAQKVWRLRMETSEAVTKIPALAGALRVFSAARSLLALIGLAVVLAAGLPASRG